jgi:hypothetical protein
MAIFQNLLRRIRGERVYRIRVPNMRTKKLRSGKTAYYWQAPERVKRLGIPMHAEALGTDFDAAVTRAIMLNRLVRSFAQKSAKKRKKSRRVPSFHTPVPVTATVVRPASAVTAHADSSVTEAASKCELDEVA